MSRVSQDEFETAPGGEKEKEPADPWDTTVGRLMKRYGVAIGVVVAVLAIGDRVWSIHTRHEHGFQSSFEAGHMPVCDSGVVRQLLKKTLDDSPAAKDGFKVLKLGDFSDVSPINAGRPVNPNPPTRTCLGEVFSNRGPIEVQSVLSWTDNDKDDLFLEVSNVIEK